MNAFYEFLAMGGYAFYVWMAYGIVLLVLLVMFIWPLQRQRKFWQELAYQKNRQQKLARRQT